MTYQPPSNQPIQPGYNPQPAPAQPNQPQLPPIVQDFASLANILTQIQYDLFDISITLAQKQTPGQIESRIDDKAIQWLTDITTKISGQLPAHQDPILPIGNILATNFYRAKNLCQQAIEQLDNLSPSGNSDVIGTSQAQPHRDYLLKLQDLLFAAFRWSNLILRERDWYWKPKSEMQQNAPSGSNQNQGTPPVGGPATYQPNPVPKN